MQFGHIHVAESGFGFELDGEDLADGVVVVAGLEADGEVNYQPERMFRRPLLRKKNGGVKSQPTSFYMFHSVWYDRTISPGRQKCKCLPYRLVCVRTEQVS